MTKEKRQDGVHVDPHLEFHDVGCVKRYGAVPDNAEMCLCERRRLNKPFLWQRSASEQPAFPQKLASDEGSVSYYGLTRRDYAAIHIFAGLVDNGGTRQSQVAVAVSCADMLLAELDKERT